MYYDLESFGKTICNIRNTLGYTQKDISNLSEISIETMRKIENGKVIPTQVTLELLSHALKEDLNLLLLSHRIPDYKSYYQTKDKIENKIESGNYDDLEEDLDSLNTILTKRNINNYIDKSIKQLSLMVESIILKINEGNNTLSLDKLIEAIKITTPHFELSKYDEFVYSSFELRILMNIALLIHRIESTVKCLEILLFCQASLDPEDIDLKIRICYNLAYTYHRIDLHEKALFCANEGIKTCIENNCMTCLALLYLRKGVAEYFLKNDNYKSSLIKARTIFEISGQDTLIDMLMKFCEKHSININE